jgi:hypothetical protein
MWAWCLRSRYLAGRQKTGQVSHHSSLHFVFTTFIICFEKNKESGVATTRATTWNFQRTLIFQIPILQFTNSLQVFLQLTVIHLSHIHRFLSAPFPSLVVWFIPSCDTLSRDPTDVVAYDFVVNWNGVYLFRCVETRMCSW